MQLVSTKLLYIKKQSIRGAKRKDDISRVELAIKHITQHSLQN